MKSTISTVAALLAAAAVSYGYTTSTGNLIVGSPSETPVVDNTGAPIPIGAGSVAVGYFNLLDDAAIGSTTDFGALLTDFVQFGQATATGFQNGFNAPGFFSHSTDAPIPNGGNNFTGNNVYTVIGNGATLAGSSQLAVWKGNAVFTQENAVGLGSVNSNVTPGAGSLIFGTSGGAKNVGVGPTFSDSIQLSAPIPEPSSALLFGLGGFALLLRRKR